MTGTGAQQAYLASGVEAALLPEAGRPLSEQVLQAHYAGDLEEMRRLCLRAEAGLAPTGMRQLTTEQLESRIRRIHVLLAAAYDEQQRRQREGSQRQQAERDAYLATQSGKAAALDPSD